EGKPGEIRDGPAAVRGDAPRRTATGPRAGKAAEEGAPSQKTCRPPRTRTPRGRRLRVKATLHSPRRGSGGVGARPRLAGGRARARARRGQDANDLRRGRAGALGQG